MVQVDGGIRAESLKKIIIIIIGLEFVSASEDIIGDNADKG